MNPSVLLIVPLLWAGIAPTELRAQTRGCLSTAGTPVQDLFLNRMESARATGHRTAAGERILARGALPAFYRSRAYQPVWIEGDRPSPCALRLAAVLHSAEEDGLVGADYHRASIDALLSRNRSGGTPPDLVDLELLLTDAYLVYGSHLLQGRVNPETVEAEWLANRRSADMAAHLDATMVGGDLEARLAELRPSQPGYRTLRERLAVLRAVAQEGGWPQVPAGGTLRPGDRDATRVPILRNRLLASGDLARYRAAEPDVFDQALEDGVRRFQLRHGLDADGAVGAQTVAALNVPISERIHQVVVNMERWRWLPDDLGGTHIRVNIADFRVEVWEGSQVAMDMRAVVGRTVRETPMFSATMTYLVLSPFWHVPPTIARVDKFPELQKNAGYVASQRMTLLDAVSNQVVDPGSVDWSQMTGAQFNQRYRLRQDPGPQNALGRVKFMFPNPHNVYLHDTPSRELFARTSRAFSSGCIRLERPLALAEYLLQADPSWPPSRINEAAEASSETTVRLRRGVPVHLLYWTAFVDDDGIVHYRSDIYGRDGRVRAALAAEAPTP